MNGIFSSLIPTERPYKGFFGMFIEYAGAQKQPWIYYSIFALILILFITAFVVFCKRKKFSALNYSIQSLIIMFFVFSFIGWVYEVIVFYILKGFFVNRGSVYGPYLSIYGVGVIAALVLLKKILNKPFFTFAAMTFVSVIVEFVSGYYLLITKNLRFWDYSRYFINLKGVISLETTVFFGVAGFICIYFVAPFLKEKVFDKASEKALNIVCGILILVLVIDSSYTFFHPREGRGITYDLESAKINTIQIT